MSNIDLSKLTKNELINKCKEHFISGYSNKNKKELIELINNKINNENIEYFINKMNKKNLIEYCKNNNITNYSNLSKKELIKHILETLHIKNEDDINDEVEMKINNTNNISKVFDSFINNIIKGDCIEMMKLIPDNSIDMVCTDPPYFLDGLCNEWNKEKLDNKGTSSIIGNLPKGMKFDRNQSIKFNEFYNKVSIEVFRILKPGGSFISFSSPRLYHSMTMAIENAGFEIRDMLGWIYTQSQVKAFSQDHIIDNDKNKSDDEKKELKELCNNWKTPQLKPAIEPMCLAVKPIEGRYIDNFEKYGTGLMHIIEETKTGDNHFPSNIVLTDNIHPLMDKVFLISKPSKNEKGIYNTHLSVKPVALISHLIKLFTKKNAIILDPFMGSGTAAVSCILNGRNYIGFDINQEYIDISNKRIRDIN